MSYYPRGRGGDDDGDDFDEYDPTPYGGGYDQSLTYGRPLSASDDICYASSSSSGHNDFDYERPSYNSSAQPSAYADEALDNEYKSYARPKPHQPRPSQGGGYQPNLPTPGSEEFGYGGEGGVGGGYHDAPPAGIVYGGRPSALASGYGGGGNEYDTPPSQDYGSGYGGGGGGRKNEYDAPPSSEYGSGYGGGGRKNEYDAPPSQEYGSGRKNEYDAPPSQEYGSGYGRKNEYDAPPSSEYGTGYERKQGYGGRKSDDEDEDKPRYGHGHGHERRNDDDDEDKPRYGQEGYGRKKYDGDDSDDDDEEKKQRRHHNRRHYDD